MALGFRVYIDESGDEGFNFSKGSSKWFILTAIITREQNDAEVVRLIDRVRAKLRKEARYTLHFRNLNHTQRLPYVDEIAKERLRAVSILVHKPSILEPEKFCAEPHLLYRYATRYLLERVSWLCRDHRKNTDDTAKIYFSKRKNMSYEDIKEYLGVLKSRTVDLDIRIDWSVFGEINIQAVSHSSMMGLQIADAVASSLFNACELSPHGFNEPRYAEMLAPIFYRKDRNLLGYGLKFWPRDIMHCEGADSEWIKRLNKK